MGCCPLLPRKPIAVLIPYQNIEERPAMLTRTREIADKINVEIRV